MPDIRRPGAYQDSGPDLASRSSPVGKIAAIILAVILAIVVWTAIYRVDATEVAVFQAPIAGTLSVESTPGWYFRLGSSVHGYRKQDNYSFEWADKTDKDRSILVQFNDGGKAHIGGNVQWEMPQDKDHVLALHVLYGSQDGVDQALMRNAINRAMILTSPLMSATESYAARRAEFLAAFADQLENGIYEIRTQEVKQADPITGEMKTVKLASITRDKDGNPIRAEESPLKKYGIKIQPPTITHVVYEEKVEAQIQQQRDNTLAIQTSQAEARKAEQAAITATKNGEAKAAAAKWEQEVVKAKAVTEAGQQAEVARIAAEREKVVAETNAARDKNVAETAAARDKSVAETAAQRDLDVATLGAQSAEQYKLQQTRIGEGDGARRQAVMAADGALAQKLEAYVSAQKYWADAFARYGGDIVPRVVTGGGGAAGQPQQTNGFAEFMGLMAAKTANDLALDMRIAVPPAGRK